MPGTLTRIVEFGLLLLLAFAPLAFGGNRYYAVYVLRVVPVVLLAVAWIAFLRTPPPPSLRTRKETPFPLRAMAPFAGYAVVLALQLAPLPLAVLRVFSATRAEIALPVPGAPSWGTLSFVPHATLEALLNWLACLAVIGAAYWAIDSRAAARRFGWVLGLSGVFQALYGAFEFLSGRQAIFGYRKIHYLDCATGTFINRNHYAAYLALCLGVLWGFVRYDLGRRDDAANASRRRERAALLFVFGVAIAVGIVLSGSRGGMLALVLSLAFTQAAFPLARKRWQAPAATLVFAACVAASVWWIGRAPLAERAGAIADDLVTANHRTSAWTGALRMVREAPLLGGGAGTYRWRYPMVRDARGMDFDHAHGDYLELAADAGVIGLAAFVAGLALLLRFIVARR